MRIAVWFEFVRSAKTRAHVHKICKSRNIKRATTHNSTKQSHKSGHLARRIPPFIRFP